MTGTFCINSTRDLAARLGVSHDFLLSLARRSQSLYAPFSIPKRQRPFQREPSAGRRCIDNPAPSLRLVQQRIHRRLLSGIALPPNVLGGVPRRSIADNAAMHAGRREVVTMDLREYFPSITNAHVFNVWRRLGCGTHVASVLTRLTTYAGHLPQGSPTSTSLANLVQRFTFLPALDRIAAASGAACSTWVDDLAFSADSARGMIAPVARELSRHGFRLARRKTRVRHGGQRREITGLTVGEAGVSVSKSRCASIRAGIHKLLEGQISADDRQAYLRRIEGAIGFISRVDSKKGARLSAQLWRTLNAGSRSAM
jgi:RNA-directed DNA polymerase